MIINNEVARDVVTMLHSKIDNFRNLSLREQFLVSKLGVFRENSIYDQMYNNSPQYTRLTQFSNIDYNSEHADAIRSIFQTSINKTPEDNFEKDLIGALFLNNQIHIFRNIPKDDTSDKSRGEGDPVPEKIKHTTHELDGTYLRRSLIKYASSTNDSGFLMPIIANAGALGTKQSWIEHTYQAKGIKVIQRKLYDNDVIPEGRIEPTIMFDDVEQPIITQWVLNTAERARPSSQKSARKVV